MKERNVIMEQKQIAFRCFVRDTEKLIVALQSGFTLEQLAENCETVCGHTCTDGYESEICNMKRWIELLIEAEENNIIPANIITFLKYLVYKRSSKTILLSIKHFCLKYTLFLEFESVKSNIIEDLDCGFDLNNIIKDHKTGDLLLSWAVFLKKAQFRHLIPDDDLLHFLKFI